ncbi:transporter substrate-binding protein [Paralimibaculum aggregatum]|nr:transporter substrate-binding protein [Limibaculum sp. NKW23]
MRLNRRQFFRSASGALAFASSAGLLRSAGIAGEAPIVVANILDQTGGLNIYSLKQIKAVAMAVEEINAAGGLLGRPLELVFYDSQSNNQFNAQYMTQALIRDKASVVHAGVTSSSREVMRPIAHKFRGLLFYNSMYEGGVCDRRHVCVAQVPGQQIAPLVPHVVKEYGKRCYILGADYIYPHTTAKWVRKFTQEAGGEDIGVEFFPLDVSNFAPALSRIQAAKPDVVWSILVGSAHNAFYRQYEATIGKANIPLASCMFGIGREQTYLSADEASGIVNATPFHDSLPTEAAQKFVRDFKAYTGEDDYVGDYAEYGYRGVNIWANAVRKAGDPSPEAVIEALPGVQFEAPGGLVTVDGQTNHATMDIHLVRTNRNQGWDHLETFAQRPPSDTQAVCDLNANPNDRTQYTLEL